MEKFYLQTDHKPLVPLINSYDLDKAPVRCKRLLMRLMKFNAEAVHVPGKQLVVADTLSRNPLQDICLSDRDHDVKAYVQAVISTRPITADRLDATREATSQDADLQAVARYVNMGWPAQVTQMPHSLHKFHIARAHLSVAEGLLLYDDRIVVPLSLRKTVLSQIHEGHQGLTKCRRRANMSVWWPEFGRDELVKTCEFCLRNKPTQKKEPLITTPLPEGLWQKIAADIFEHDGKQYLVVMDYYSRDIEIAHLPTISSQQVITRMKSMFVRWGIPFELITDNGTQFTSAEFREFSKKYNFGHTTSSPHYPQANGAAERCVATAKRILHQPDPHLALMSYRATPISATGLSPAQLMIGRQLRTTVPILPKQLNSSPIDYKTVRLKDKQAKATYRFFYNRRHSTQPLPALQPGQSVNIKLDGEKAWKTPAKVIAKATEPRSYYVQTEQGTLARRNRRHIQVVPESPVPSTAVETRDLRTDHSCDMGQASIPPSAPVAATPAVPLTARSTPRRTLAGRAIKPPIRFQDYVTK